MSVRDANEHVGNPRPVVVGTGGAKGKGEEVSGSATCFDIVGWGGSVKKDGVNVKAAL